MFFVILVFLVFFEVLGLVGWVLLVFLGFLRSFVCFGDFWNSGDFSSLRVSERSRGGIRGKGEGSGFFGLALNLLSAKFR